MAIDFPNTPSPGQTFTAGGKTWTFTDGKWVISPFSASALTTIPSHTVERYVGSNPSSEGARITLQGGTGYPNPGILDRFNNELRYADNGVIVLKARDGHAELGNNGANVILGGKTWGGLAQASSGARPTTSVEGFLIYETDTKRTMQWNGSAWVAYKEPRAVVAIANASATADLGLTATSTQVPGCSLSFPGLKTGDVIDIYAQAHCHRLATGADMLICPNVNGANQWNAWWNPPSVNDKDTIPCSTLYTVPSDGTYAVSLHAFCFSGAGFFRVNGATGGQTTYSTTIKATVYGIR